LTVKIESGEDGQVSEADLPPTATDMMIYSRGEHTRSSKNRHTIERVLSQDLAC
jgi:hypothetical protein